MLPTKLTDTWMQDMDFPARLFGSAYNDYELFEEDDEFVLTIDMPGFERDDISVSWNDGVLHIGAEQEDSTRGKRRTYRRTFQLPKEIDVEETAAKYRNGVLEVRLPIRESSVTGIEIDIQD